MASKNFSCFEEFVRMGGGGGGGGSILRGSKFNMTGPLYNVPQVHFPMFILTPGLQSDIPLGHLPPLFDTPKQ